MQVTQLTEINKTLSGALNEITSKNAEARRKIEDQASKLQNLQLELDQVLKRDPTPPNDIVDIIEAFEDLKKRTIAEREEQDSVIQQLKADLKSKSDGVHPSHSEKLHLAELRILEQQSHIAKLEKNCDDIKSKHQQECEIATLQMQTLIASKDSDRAEQQAAILQVRTDASKKEEALGCALLQVHDLQESLGSYTLLLSAAQEENKALRDSLTEYKLAISQLQRELSTANSQLLSLSSHRSESVSISTQSESVGADIKQGSQFVEPCHAYISEPCHERVLEPCLEGVPEPCHEVPKPALSETVLPIPVVTTDDTLFSSILNAPLITNEAVAISTNNEVQPRKKSKKSASAKATPVLAQRNSEDTAAIGILTRSGSKRKGLPPSEQHSRSQTKKERSPRQLDLNTEEDHDSENCSIVANSMTAPTSVAAWRYNDIAEQYLSSKKSNQPPLCIALPASDQDTLQPDSSLINLEARESKRPHVHNKVLLKEVSKCRQSLSDVKVDW